MEVCTAIVYGTDEEVEVEVYTPKKPLALDHPEGACSRRYLNLLIKGAKECDLAADWISMLESLPVYVPTEETLAKRQKMPSLSDLPVMTIEELAAHNGDDPEKSIYVSSCGYIFKLILYLES